MSLNVTFCLLNREGQFSGLGPRWNKLPGITRQTEWT